jgi:uncharacterized protein (TIRG00374 family)
LTLSPKLIRQVIIWLVVGVGLYGGIVVFSGYTDVKAALSAMGINGWLTILGLSSLNFLIRFLRWHMYIRALDCRVPWFKNLQYFIAGFAFTSTPAKAGEAVRSVYLKRYNVKYSDSLAALFVERLTDLLAVVLFALAAALAFENWRWLVYAAGIGTLTILPLVRSQAIRKKLSTLAERNGATRLGTGLNHLVALLKSSAALLKAGPLYGGMFLSVVGAGLVCTIMYVVLQGLGVTISPDLAVGIYATGILAGALSFLPGGIGSAEAVMIGLLVLAGVDTVMAASAVLICRIAALWYSVALGLLTVITIELTDRKQSAENKSAA